MMVSKSGFYKYLKSVKKTDWLLMVTVRSIAQKSKFSYGKRRMSHALKQLGYNFGVYATRTLMHKFDVRYKRKKIYRYYGVHKDSQPASENILKRNFVVTKPNEVWVADITTIKTTQGAIYVAAILDLFSRKIVGWAVEDSMKENITIDALNMALKKRSPSTQVLHHSDQGSQYRSYGYKSLLNKVKFISSMNRKGNCLDNAVMERFWSSLKRERMNLKIYVTRSEAKLDVIDYIEDFYNTTRLHSFLGYRSPVQFEQIANLK
jgi:putative transposase